MRVICINDKDKPAEIPIEKWVKEYETYTVIKVVRTMDGQNGFILKEITLGEDTFPYDSFAPKRFIDFDDFKPASVEEEINKLIVKESCRIEN
jgi:hypothetical protein